MVQVKVEAADFTLVELKLRKASTFFMQKISEFALEEMRRRAPERTGRLKRSIRLQPAPVGGTAVIGPTVPYAVFVEYGTRPHEILPVRAQALRFEVEGRVVYAKSVRHPGTKPQFFIRGTAEAVQKNISRIWLDSWK